MTSAIDFQLRIEPDGRLVYQKENQKIISVTVKRCFPWSEPFSWLSLRGDDGQEVHLIENAFELEEESRGALLSALKEASFVFRIEKILSVVEEFELRLWHVQLSQGERVFQTRLMSWPRELPGGELLIQDVGNDLYLLESIERLDRKSRQYLWAFLD